MNASSVRETSNYIYREHLFPPTGKDMRSIKRFLEREQKSTGHSFICNWGTIESLYNDHHLQVYKEEPNHVPRALVSDPCRGDFLLIVKPRHRGDGRGQAIVEALMQHEINERRNTLWLFEVAPHRAASFWAKCGFNIHVRQNFQGDSEQKLFGWRILDLDLDPLPEGRKVWVTFRFWSQSRAYPVRENDLPEDHCFKTISTYAVLTAKGEVHFPKRIQLHAVECLQPFAPPDQLGLGDIVVELFIEKKSILVEKSKRPEWKQLGLKTQSCSSGLFVDRITLPDDLLSLIPETTIAPII